jgi:hypothetical protein
MKLDQSAWIVGNRAAEPRLVVYDPADVVDPERLVGVEVTELRQSLPRRAARSGGATSTSMSTYERRS